MLNIFTLLYNQFKTFSFLENQNSFPAKTRSLPPAVPRPWQLLLSISMNFDDLTYLVFVDPNCIILLELAY